MGWESSGVVGFHLGPLLQGQTRTAKLKSAYNSLITGPRGFGALSLRWIQFASVLRCARSSLFFAVPPDFFVLEQKLYPSNFVILFDNYICSVSCQFNLPIYFLFFI